MIRNIIWLGAIFDDETVLNHENISPAGNKWQKQLIESMQENSCSVNCLGHLPERIFPYGKLFISKKKGGKLFGNNGISYINLPFIRNVIINISIFLEFIVLRKNYRNLNYIISYNIYDYNCVAAFLIKYFFKLQWIILIADPKNDKTEDLHSFTKYGDKFVYLSWMLFKKSPLKNKLHLDGGINEVVKSNSIEQTEKYILYSGKIAEHTGVHFLIDSFNKISNPNYKLYITGKGSSKYLDNAAKLNPNILNKGFLNEHELSVYSQNASILINPRLISHETNISNFPSKILEYLSYTRPIISTKTLGISPEYDRVINFIHSDSQEELKNKIIEIMNWSEEQRLCNLKLMKEFNKIRSWDYQSKKLIHFIDAI
ncbi:glycosyltransferase, GG-Bacteroidales peptide system [Pedobacter glucosidilyticus]|nr:glycosyltransferase [Pedobacter glucosidilyticus]KHJ39131.1 glycosyltransferase, GG-Bacteroidales peptide system [Pedobacter glucosidilyticus]